MKSIYVVEDTLPVAWEQAVIRCWYEGSSFPTEYDKLGDPNSRDVVAMIHIRRPFDEPRINKCMPTGLEDLEKYRSEIIYGVHDHWVDPLVGKWEYTYYMRLFEYQVPQIGIINQIAEVIKKLSLAPHTRRAQAVTWQVWNDININDPSCLQRLWFRIEGNKLNMTAHMRSNDAFKAAFMNMYGFTELQREIAKQLNVGLGEYIHIVDSFHIYGSYFADFEGFLKKVESRPLQDRVYSTTGVVPGTENERVADIFIEACDSLLAESDMPEIKKECVRRRKAELLAAR